MTTDLSIVIPVYGQLHHLVNCLDSLMRTLPQGGGYEVVLVDDCSPDFDLRRLALVQGAKVLRTESNAGFGQACNLGAKSAAGRILFFLNSDTLAHPGWYAPLLGAFDDPKVGVVGPKLVFPPDWWCPECKLYRGDPQEGQVDANDPSKGKRTVCFVHPSVGLEQVERVQSCGGLFDAGKGPFHRHMMWRADDPKVNVPEEVSWVTGAAIAVRAGLFAECGGFDPGYIRAYFEDVDACTRVRKAGWVVWYEPRACFTHLVGQSGSTPGPCDAERHRTFWANSRRFHRLHDGWVTVDYPWQRVVPY